MNVTWSTEQHMDSSLLTPQRIKEQNRYFKGTGGISQENGSSGFLPAFSDTRTGHVYLSRFADGRLAPMHLLDGLPSELVLSRNATGRVTAVKECVQAGFVKQGRFYTREQAAIAVTGH
jgi:hypothetical protein